MGVIKSGHNSVDYPNNFGASDAVTATALNNHVNDSKFDTTAVDDLTIELTTSDTKLQVKDDGITFAKMQNISTDKVLGRTTAGSGAVEELDLLDENDMNSDSDTAVATQKSIKAYVDKPSVFQQVILVNTFEFTNNSSTSVTPVSGSKGHDAARYLIQDDAGDEAKKQITITSGNKVKISYTIYGDTNDANVGVSLFLERSTDNGVSFASIPECQAASFGNRLRATSNLHHGYGARSLGSSSYTFIDTPGVTNPIYRVTMSILSGYRFRLNRCNNDADNDGYGVVTSALLLEEVQG
jgi:hypothetical protein